MRITQRDASIDRENRLPGERHGFRVQGTEPAYHVHLPDQGLINVQMHVLAGISATRQIISDFPDAKIAIVADYGSASSDDDFYVLRTLNQLFDSCK